VSLCNLSSVSLRRSGSGSWTSRDTGSNPVCAFPLCAAKRKPHDCAGRSCLSRRVCSARAYPGAYLNFARTGNAAGELRGRSTASLASSTRPSAIVRKGPQKCGAPQRPTRNRTRRGSRRLPRVSLTSMLFKAARMSATGRAMRKGPNAYAKRLVRRQIGRAWGRSGVPRWPR
jgi:hypothetical protein